MMPRFGWSRIDIVSLHLWMILTLVSECRGDVSRRERQQWSPPPYRRKSPVPTYNGPQFSKLPISSYNFPRFPDYVPNVPKTPGNPSINYKQDPASMYNELPQFPNYPSWFPYSRFPKAPNTYEFDRWVFPGSWIDDKAPDTGNGWQESSSATAYPSAVFEMKTEIQGKQRDPSADEKAKRIDEDSSTMNHDTSRITKDQGTNLSKQPSRTETIQLADLTQEEISKLIEEALKRGELLNREEWSKRRNNTRATHKLPQTKNISDFEEAFFAVPACNDTFCVNATGYPEHLVNLAIQRDDSLKLLASDDLANHQAIEIAQRMIDDWNEMPFCRARTSVVFPRSAMSVDQRWLFVVNQKNFKQPVRIEVCVQEDSDCDGMSDFLPLGYKTRCKQSYIHRELATVSHDGTIKKDMFRFPASCCCHRYWDPENS